MYFRVLSADSALAPDLVRGRLGVKQPVLEVRNLLHCKLHILSVMAIEASFFYQIVLRKIHSHKPIGRRQLLWRRQQSLCKHACHL